MSPRPRSHSNPRLESVLLVGPGARLEVLVPVLRALMEKLDAQHGPAPEVSALADIEDLVTRPQQCGVLLLDAESLALEDLGYPRRFLARRPHFHCTLIGDDPGTRVARALLGTRGMRWLHWPPDLREMQDLVEEAQRGGGPPSAALGERSSPFGGEPLRATTPIEQDELAAIQAILEGREPHGLSQTTSAMHDGGPAHASAGETAEREASGTQEKSYTLPTQRPPQVAENGPPSWYREQVADLSDVAQRVELAQRALREALRHAHGPADADLGRRAFELDAEVARLVEFTRTLGYVAAPPSGGAQVFDMGEMLHLFVAGIANRGVDAPRCQFRAHGTAMVCADRALLGQAFDAFFFLARACAQPGEVLRAQVRRIEGRNGDARTALDERARAQVLIEFPAGALADLAPQAIIEPYGLRKRMPDLGASSLAAALAIVAGQGGAAQLVVPSRGRLEWRVELPCVADEDAIAAPASELGERRA